ncbi:CaiB/BaiF CoA-transferase family protein [uncultured Roseovarius sp.]|uniref:CaiB/BaiF CoA transferase family protein n=1 Tax=uncultured Roseovarius sp. TaxID=293344 RepID=UPI00260B9AA7|nr:CaiB/BaiF CoA-transferase family protein [uncultured Roseovarius sp.]
MLQGTRIIEIEGLGPGPFAAMLLADLGAEVIVIHRPGPAPEITGDPSILDRGKKSVTLDLKDGKDLAAARALINSADAMIEGFRPGVMERLGLGPIICLADNPKLVYGRMTGWGQDGPRASTAGHDYNYIATSGALWYTSLPGTPPIAPATLVGDIGGGALYLVAGILAGLLSAARTGKGTVVDAAIVDGSAHMMTLLMAMQPAGNLKMQRGQSLLDGPHWSRCYACVDGHFLSVQCLEPKFYAEFLSLMGLDNDPRFSEQFDRSLWPDQTEAMAKIIGSKPIAHWRNLFDGSDACVAPVLSPEDAAQEMHMSERDVWQRVDGRLQPAPAPRFDGQSGEIVAPPRRGQHTEEILAELHSR